MNGYVYSYVYDFNPDPQFFGFLTSYSIFFYPPSTFHSHSYLKFTITNNYTISKDLTLITAPLGHYS